MTLRYCFKCSTTFDESKSLAVNKEYYCYSCKERLIYFGAEQWSLSSDELLASYDAEHVFDPVSDYVGVYKDYQTNTGDIRLLECDDILKHNPTNKEALVYLAKDAFSKGSPKRTIHLYNKIHYADLEKSDISFYTSFLFSQHEYKELIDFVSQDFLDILEFDKYHYLAIAYMGLHQFEDALQFFYKGYYLCEDGPRKQKLKMLIRRISGYLRAKKIDEI